MLFPPPILKFIPFLFLSQSTLPTIQTQNPDYKSCTQYEFGRPTNHDILSRNTVFLLYHARQFLRLILLSFRCNLSIIHYFFFHPHLPLSIFVCVVFLPVVFLCYMFSVQHINQNSAYIRMFHRNPSNLILFADSPRKKARCVATS